MEYMATLYLALVESGLLSFIQIHERPVNTNIGFWEEAFRGNSSRLLGMSFHIWH